MAGGTFSPGISKIRPGTYINFKSVRDRGILTSTRGTVVIPLDKAAYGPEKEFISLSVSSPDAAKAKLGYSIYDNDPNNQMLMIREAFKNAQTVYVYNTASGGTKATATSEGLTATAKYPGSRGNDIRFSIIENPDTSDFNVEIYLGASKVAEYEKIKTIDELASTTCDYIVFSGSGDLKATAGISLESGTDGTSNNTDVSEFLDALEQIAFNTLAFPFKATELQTALLTKIKYFRENAGKKVQAVAPDFAADYEGIINVTNSVVVGDVALTKEQVTAWVAGATAGAEYTESLTYVEYVGATDIVDVKVHEDAEGAIKKGEFFFSFSEDRKIVVEYDINSLVTYGDDKDRSYSKNRVIRVFDSFHDYVKLNFPPNKYDNDETGWTVMEGIGKAILKVFDMAGGIKDVDYDNDFRVDTELSMDDETYFNVYLHPVDSAEKLYFTVMTS